ncbi:class I SAM-dependent methyltransferase [Blastococcus litoris]|uniref:class I SAM-dependent methyltransferase n=1 Tax=Blastococcus litoris TaxID=2171622 RepID=UPI000E305D1E|nr:methyltransferase [Blastococcus litoris]
MTAAEDLFGALRRAPDVEAPELVAVDATDRLLLDEAAAALALCGPGEVAVVDDAYGALTLGAVALHGASDVRVAQDLLVGERALALNAGRTDLTGTYRQLPLDEVAAGARVVLVQAPKALDALREIAERVAAVAAPDVTVLVGGRVKHMTHAMNDVLGDSFGDVSATLARQKSRVLVARRPEPAPSSFPRRQEHPDLGLTVCAHGAAFAGTKVDIGTRTLLGVLEEQAPGAGTALDLGCGTGVLATVLARSRPGLAVLAADQSAAAVASAAATAEANGVADRVRVVRDDAADSLDDASVDLVACNPPFHVGAAVVTTAADRLFAAAARVLRPGGELFTVYNSALRYKPVLGRVVGPTRVARQTPKFTVTVSTRR